ncbi:MAG: hypothetical protein U0401_27870 [Anaerolineae bacterium]
MALLLPGPITDGGWHQFAYSEGSQRLKEEGFDVAFAGSIKQADIPNSPQYADDGYQLIIGHGLNSAAPPSKSLPITPTNSSLLSSNLRISPPTPCTSTRLIGMTLHLEHWPTDVESRRRRFVGGGIIHQRGIMNTFILAAEKTVPGTKPSALSPAITAMPPKVEKPATMVGNGADVIRHAARHHTGLGAPSKVRS